MAAKDIMTEHCKGPDRPTLSLSYGTRGTAAAPPPSASSPGLANHELRRIVASILG